MCIRQDAIGL